MEIKGYASIHNKFDFEVYDAETGELKQRAIAENIVLDNGFAFLINSGLTTPTSYISIGTGVGAPDPTRVSLFTHLGTLNTTQHEVVLSDPISYRKLLVTLNPEDYIGASITEVGFGQNNNLATHAMIKDGEGNQISILKMATDVVKVYATIFAVLRPSQGIRWALPRNNNAIKWLLGLTSLSQLFPAFGSSDVDRPCPETAVSSGGQTEDPCIKGIQYTANKQVNVARDVSARTLSLPTTRFSISECNGPVLEFGLRNVLRMIMQDGAPYAETQYTDVPIGTGDGVKKKFRIPSRHAKKLTVEAKVAGAVTPITTTGIEVLDTPHFTEPQTTMPWSDPVEWTGYTFSVHRIGSDKLFVYQNNSGNHRIAMYDQDTGALRAIAYPGSLSSNEQIHIINDNTYARHNFDNTKLYSIDIGTGAIALLENPVTFIATGQYGMYRRRFSRDLNVIVRETGKSSIEVLRKINEAYQVVYSFNGSGDAITELTRDGNVLLICDNNGTHMCDWNGTTYVPRTLLATVKGMYYPAIGDGTYLIWNDNASQVIKRWTGTVWEDLDVSEIMSLLASIGVTYINFSGREAAVSPDCQYIYVLAGQTKGVQTFKLEGNKYVRKSVDEVSIVDSTITTSFTQVSTITGFADGVLSGNNRSERSKGYAFLKRRECFVEVEFATPPAAGTAITASYKTKGIHKTDQYVIDVSCTIQLGEGL